MGGLPQLVTNQNQTGKELIEANKQNYMRMIIGLLGLLLILGCASESQQIAVLNEKLIRQAKAATAPIEILMDQQPTRPYAAIAISSVTGDERNLRDDIESLRQKARSVGADAIIIRSSQPMLDRGPIRTTYQVTREATIIIWK